LKHMFDCDNLNNSKASRRYICDFILLAAIIFGCLIAICTRNMYLTRGESVELSISHNGDKTTGYISFEDEGLYAIVFVNGYETDPDIYKLGTSVSDDDSMVELLDSKSGLQSGSYEYNVLYISDGKVDMIMATCPDLICVHTKTAEYNGDSICCLPHGLIITVVSDDENQENIDAVTW